ncbi:MAG: hypothetical protein K8T20_11615 [Planctomycetes bacterium]|nr:hypothetical protein [Planctomycetota bacterium]
MAHAPDPRLAGLRHTVGLLTGYWVALLAMPFHGFVTELPLVLLLGAAVSGPMYLFLRSSFAARRAADAAHTAEMKAGISPAAEPRKTISPFAVVALGVFLPAMALSLFSIISRVNYACWLGWKCDGVIVEVTRDKPNHAAPMVIVNTAGDTERFVQVDDDFWASAKPGQRLKKDAGSPMAWLDGRKVRMVPRQVGWWNEPK